MPNHPPIPPNCRFFTDDGYFYAATGEIINWRLDTQSVDERLIIAAVAEVAWRKEAERLAAECCKYLNINMSGLKAPKEADPITANFNTFAWREWGEGGKEESK